ncbi:polyketide cyclase [Acerihabitans sp.]|uniref:polyketide cyclase n=1 Tax=Acerihabitans sp. TaxID=2811394 RepID=UPI002ED814B1
MTSKKTDDNALLFEYALDAPAEKVWRAISIPALREQWLPGIAGARADILSATQGAEICLRLREDEPPYLESRVTLRIRPNHSGGTLLTIIHRLDDSRLNNPTSPAANDDTSCLMLVA